MASSDNLAAVDAWAFRSMLPDACFSEAYDRETETMIKALQQSFSDNSESVVSDTFSPFFNPVNTETPSVQTQSGSGGSDHETSGTKRRNNATTGPTGGRITKRKPRASKRTTTTFITADPANFRQMVQQVTGVRFPGNGQLPVPQLVKPEPKRAMNRLQGCLPTLDTSAYFLAHQQQPMTLGPVSTSPTVSQPSTTLSPSIATVDGGASFDFDTFSGFPTLESWKVL